ncbi:MAG: glycoside hydrolase family 88 protein [Acidobacteriota bacterium]|nr:glycoside hydrolase family 88 protein [Acidobacteriota bacterium]
MLAAALPLAMAQRNATPQQLAGIAKDNSRHFGDDPDNPGPLATGLSYSIAPKAVAKAMRKVGDWELKRSQPYFDRIWTWSVLYAGFMAASDSLHDAKYRDAMEAMGKEFDWQLRSRLPNADDQSLGQTYLESYLLRKDPAMMRPAKGALDRVLAAPRDSMIPGKEIPWWWCDALFMAPPVWARMYAATGDHKYINYLDDEWERTSNLLYDTKEHLYSRDVTFLNRTEANGQKMFWSRGNGWVMGGIARTLEYLPKDDPARAKYIEQLKEMSARVASIQGEDGLWRAGLLDPGAYDLPEISGSALMTFAMAWGVNNGILDAKVYRPVIEKAWIGMLHHIYDDGRLGCIQQTGAEPAPFKASASYNYGVGGFLLAGSEIYKMHAPATRIKHAKH